MCGNVCGTLPLSAGILLLISVIPNCQTKPEEYLCQAALFKTCCIGVVIYFI